MDSDDPKRMVSRGYDAIHQHYAKWGVDSEARPRQRYIERVIASGMVPKGGTALDLGCGTGAHATRLLADHFPTTGVDISEASIAAAREELPRVTFIAADMASVEFAAESFDLVTAFYSIIHLPRTEHAGVVQRIVRWLRPGGVAIMTFSADGGEGFDPNWLGVPMFWDGWDIDTNERLIRDAGLEIVESVVERIPEDDRVVRFLYVIARKMIAIG